MVVRGGLTAASDIDVLFNLDPDRGTPLLRVAGIAEELRQLPGVRVDIVVKPGVGLPMARWAIGPQVVEDHR